jgi:TonB family protein
MRRHRPTWSPALAMARSSSLERRITAMLNVRVTRTPVTRASRVVIAAALAAIAAPLAGLTMFAQALATFSGSVVDPSGAVLPNATLTLANAERRATYAVQTDRDGRFEFVGLPPGEYAFEARVPGFESVRRALTMDGQDVREDIELQVGTLQETIMVVDDGTGSARDSRVNDLSGAAPRPCSVTPAATAGPPVGGRIRPPRKLRDVRPVYPESLRASKAQGEVKLKGIIGVDGLVKTADVVSAPHPDLAAAAVEAVRQWAFDSTLLNCEPIEVTMNVSVTFRPQP